MSSHSSGSTGVTYFANTYALLLLGIRWTTRFFTVCSVERAWTWAMTAILHLRSQATLHALDSICNSQSTDGINFFSFSQQTKLCVLRPPCKTASFNETSVWFCCPLRIHSTPSGLPHSELTQQCPCSGSQNPWGWVWECKAFSHAAPRDPGALPWPCLSHSQNLFSRADKTKNWDEFLLSNFPFAHYHVYNII